MAVGVMVLAYLAVGFVVVAFVVCIVTIHANASLLRRAHIGIMVSLGKAQQVRIFKANLIFVHCENYLLRRLILLTTLCRLTPQSPQPSM
jgi:hypothetical protein